MLQRCRWQQTESERGDRQILTPHADSLRPPTPPPHSLPAEKYRRSTRTPRSGFIHVGRAPDICTVGQQSHEGRDAYAHRVDPNQAPSVHQRRRHGRYSASMYCSVTHTYCHTLQYYHIFMHVSGTGMEYSNSTKTMGT
jgi:hypothetical protein